MGKKSKGSKAKRKKQQQQSKVRPTSSARTDQTEHKAGSDFTGTETKLHQRGRLTFDEQIQQFNKSAISLIHGAETALKENNRETFLAQHQQAEKTLDLAIQELDLKLKKKENAQVIYEYFKELKGRLYYLKYRYCIKFESDTPNKKSLLTKAHQHGYDPTLCNDEVLPYFPTFNPNQHTHAINAYKESFQKSREEINLYMAQQNFLKAKEEIEKAINTLEQFTHPAIKHLIYYKRKKGYLYSKLGTIYAQLNQTHKAIAAFKISSAYNFHISAIDLAQQYIHLGEINKAHPLLKETILTINCAPIFKEYHKSLITEATGTLAKSYWLLYQEKLSQQNLQEAAQLRIKVATYAKKAHSTGNPVGHFIEGVLSLGINEDPTRHFKLFIKTIGALQPPETRVHFISSLKNELIYSYNFLANSLCNTHPNYCRYLTQAANLGNAEAAIQLGHYYKTLRPNQTLGLAKQWYTTAITLGSKNAEIDLLNLHVQQAMFTPSSSFPEQKQKDLTKLIRLIKEGVAEAYYTLYSPLIKDYFTPQQDHTRLLLLDDSPLGDRFYLTCALSLIKDLESKSSSKDLQALQSDKNARLMAKYTLQLAENLIEKMPPNLGHAITLLQSLPKNAHSQVSARLLTKAYTLKSKKETTCLENKRIDESKQAQVKPQLTHATQLRQKMKFKPNASAPYLTIPIKQTSPNPATLSDLLFFIGIEARRRATKKFIFSSFKGGDLIQLFNVAENASLNFSDLQLAKACDGISKLGLHADLKELYKLYDTLYKIAIIRLHRLPSKEFEMIFTSLSRVKLPSPMRDIFLIQFILHYQHQSESSNPSLFDKLPSLLYACALLDLEKFDNKEMEQQFKHFITRLLTNTVTHLRTAALSSHDSHKLLMAVTYFKKSKHHIANLSLLSEIQTYLNHHPQHTRPPAPHEESDTDSLTVLKQQALVLSNYFEPLEDEAAAPCMTTTSPPTISYLQRSVFDFLRRYFPNTQEEVPHPDCGIPIDIALSYRELTDNIPDDNDTLYLQVDGPSHHLCDIQGRRICNTPKTDLNSAILGNLIRLTCDEISHCQTGPSRTLDPHKLFNLLNEKLTEKGLQTIPPTKWASTAPFSHTIFTQGTPTPDTEDERKTRSPTP